MPVYDSFADFEAAAQEFYQAAPANIRFVTKFQPTEGAMRFKLTNDVVTLQYCTQTPADFDRVRVLQETLASAMHNISRPADFDLREIETASATNNSTSAAGAKPAKGAAKASGGKGGNAQKSKKKKR
ncbi:hypothetical protein H4R33_004903 [Dimargaris cristalligena]|uniref:SRP9 domain-containing protein n=1 Tax=Dimargaris cristalligena TaxID=215637 RepID=A0A4Q0A3M7_9FUNG|nr:hypothetical protein H4R33_004903 [Dimargaris cristalligena]RKP40191.1 hypothetical protein BJ085DRAFT_30362 [Dimargaris cristalligena]|eukprot:RKP40191.1 hypothetical protein BJ085DRAFT_30362 [Dimargaris cristalligena]